MNVLSAMFFHLKIFSKNSYFVMLMISQTITMILLQYIVSYHGENSMEQYIWIRAGIFGMWATVTTSAGAVMFQKFKGTLPYLINAKMGDKLSIATLITPISTFGLLAFPLSYLICYILRLNMGTCELNIVIAILSLYISAI